MDEDFNEASMKSGGGKRKNVEKRREKSRTAARCRRSRESDIFTDLYDVVPLVPEPTVSHVDRIAILRLAASLCKIRQVVPKVFDGLIVKKECTEGEGSSPEEGSPDLGSLLSENSLSLCLDGFVIVADSEDTILYISEGVSATLGLTQTDIIGQSLSDFIHGDDLEEFKRHMSSSDGASKKGEDKSEVEDGEKKRRIILRVKSVLSPRGRNLNLKSATYKAVTFTAQKMKSANRVVESEAEFIYVLHGSPVYSTVQQQAYECAQTGVFMTRHTSDMKFSYSHERITECLGYDVKSLMGTSFFALVHPEDLGHLSETLKELFKKGQCRTRYYRLLAKNGGIVWVQTEATTLTHSTRGQRGQYVVCMHTVIGNFRSEDICGDIQQEGWHPESVRAKSRSPKTLTGVSPLGSDWGCSKGGRRLAGAVAFSPNQDKKQKRQRPDEDKTDCQRTAAVVAREFADENFDTGRQKSVSPLAFGNPYGFNLGDGSESIKRWLISDYQPHVAKGDKAEQTLGGKLFLSDPSGGISFGIERRNAAGGFEGFSTDDSPSSPNNNNNSRPARSELTVETIGPNAFGPSADRLAALSLDTANNNPGGGNPGQPSPNKGPSGETYAGSSATVPASGPQSSPAGCCNVSVPPRGGSGLGKPAPAGAWDFNRAVNCYEATGTGAAGPGPSHLPDGLRPKGLTKNPSGDFGTLFDAIFTNNSHDNNNNNAMDTGEMRGDFFNFRNNNMSSNTLTSANSSVADLEEIDLAGLCDPRSEMLAPFVHADEFFDLESVALMPFPLDFDE